MDHRQLAGQLDRHACNTLTLRPDQSVGPTTIDQMEIANLVLEYLRVLLTAPLLFSVVAIVFFYRFTEDIKALLLRVAKIRLPGGAEVDTPQSRRIEREPRPVNTEEVPVQGIPAGLTPDQEQAITQLLRAQIATTYIWEYRYLNYFLARGTQLTLDWLVGLPQSTNLRPL